MGRQQSNKNQTKKTVLSVMTDSRTSALPGHSQVYRATILSSVVKVPDIIEKYTPDWILHDESTDHCLHWTASGYVEMHSRCRHGLRMQHWTARRGENLHGDIVHGGMADTRHLVSERLVNSLMLVRKRSLWQRTPHPVYTMFSSHSSCGSSSSAFCRYLPAVL